MDYRTRNVTEGSQFNKAVCLDGAGVGHGLPLNQHRSLSDVDTVDEERRR